MLDLQRTTSRTLSVNATEVAISKGNAGDASYSARLSSLSERKQHEVQNMQNFLTYAQIQDAGLENVLQVMDRMAMIAGSAANGMISTSERARYNDEFESLKETLYAMQGTQFQGHYVFQESVKFDSGLNEREQSPTAPDTYEHENVDSTDDSHYNGKTDLSRWTATKDVRYDRGTLTLKVNSGIMPERYYVKQGANNIFLTPAGGRPQGVLINTMTINSSFNSPPERPPPTTIVGSTVTGIKTAWMGTKTMLRIIPVPEGRCSTITVIRLLPIHP